jgi:hypothetical protein
MSTAAAKVAFMFTTIHHAHAPPQTQALSGGDLHQNESRE